MTAPLAGARRPRDARHVVRAVAIGGALAVLATVATFPLRIDAPLLREALILTVLTAAAELIAIRVQHAGSSENLTLFELAVVADVVLLPPAAALLVSCAGLAVALIVQRKPPAKFIFNVGQYAIAITPAIAAYRYLGGGDFQATAGLLALFGGMIVFTAINFVAISAIIAATSARALRAVLNEERSVSFAMGLGNTAVGMVAVSLYLHRPALLPAVIAPAFAMHVAFRGWVKQKELTSSMAQESTKLGRILESSSEGIVLVDGDGLVDLWSPSMERMTGIPALEAAGRSIAYLLRGHDVYGRSVSLDVCESAEPTDIGIVSTDGNPVWLRVRFGPGYDERGRLAFNVLVITDITRQREVDRLKEDFFSTVSHELRTPLTPIKGYATLLLRRAEDLTPERRQEALQSILERTDHMARLVEDLLLASRMANVNERRMPEVSRQDVDVRGVVERALRSFRNAHPSREFRVRGDERITATGDPIRVEQVIANLVSNAVKFSDEGTLVDVVVESDAREVVISVTDEGRGIPPDKLEEIFERFKRLEDPMKMETGGAGLGLFIVRELVRAMGGRVTVTSKLGRGSTFIVSLPLAGAPAGEQPRRRAADEPGEPIAPPRAVRSGDPLAG